MLSATGSAVSADSQPITGASPFALTLTPSVPAYADAVTANPADQSHEMSLTKRPAAAGPLPSEITHSWKCLPSRWLGSVTRSCARRIGSANTHSRAGLPTGVLVRRAFTSIPDGKIEFEYWLIAQIPRHGATELQHLFELEVGLPHRFQFDLYLVDRHEGSGGKAFVDGKFAAALRSGRLECDLGQSDTLHRMEIDRFGTDELEAKVLVGGEIAPRWHWGANAVYDGQTGGDGFTSYELTVGISYTLLDEKFSVGAETHVELYDVNGHRGNFKNDVFIGPSIQYRPRPTCTSISLRSWA